MEIDASENVHHLLQQAVRLHRQGRLVEAERVLERVLQQAPNHFDALHLLGVFKAQKGQCDEGVELISAAVRLNPRSTQALCNLGILLGRLNRHDEAISTFDKALAIKPNDVEIICKRSNALRTLGRYEEALAGFDAALKIQPTNLAALNNRGNVLRKLGRGVEAVASFDKALEIKPGYAKALSNRGITLGELGRFDEAIASYDEALRVQPEYADALNNRGNALVSLGLYHEAIVSFEGALKIKPGYPAALNNLGNALAGLGRYEHAIASFDRALELAPRYSEALINRGHVFRELKRPIDALSSYSRALQIDPQNADALNSRGVAESDLGRHEEALTSFNEALAVKPEFAMAHSNRIFTLDFVPHFEFLQHQEARHGWWRMHGKDLAGETSSYPNSRLLSRKLVLGYVSADFRQHSAASTFKPVLSSHDRESFAVVCYSGVVIEDDLTRDFRRFADKWRAVQGMTDEALATQIRADEVDILIDLSGHSAGNRLPVFARKPAPIQVTAWGHATGTGLPTIDYLFSDPVAVPKTVRGLFAEKIYDLPCLVTFDAPSDAPPVSELPATSRGVVTFGCFNRFNKVSPAVLDSWARILRLVPGARLLLKDVALDDPSLRDSVLRSLARHGIDADRIELRGRSSRHDHLDAFKNVDIALDPFPQNGGVSTWEALWMGVPVVAKLGNSLPSRLSGAILSALGLTDWIAKDAEDYVALAVRKASNLDGIAVLRKQLRQRIAASPAGNAMLYARAVEDAYRAMWHRWCCGQ